MDDHIPSTAAVKSMHRPAAIPMERAKRRMRRQEVEYGCAGRSSCIVVIAIIALILLRFLTLYVSSKVVVGGAVLVYVFDVGVVLWVCDAQRTAVCLVVVAPFGVGSEL
ncbi:uncharacterized protein APUU_12043S [Aspergillus puulaauensis]|uniref:Uncharacterized protein n=1 Tax=Aspergillus puulaauensis TaxID=1220207 RepID=A0A7R7XDE4_9EURO|nr:uncharacterized protein APUU_12043S [Aspergillus puulaauensis]BCS19215.1 hypothetical protein APUU_12043S [Aspergillus puulaauensis]